MTNKHQRQQAIPWDAREDATCCDDHLNTPRHPASEWQTSPSTPARPSKGCDSVLYVTAMESSVAGGPPDTGVGRGARAGAVEPPPLRSHPS